MNAKQIKAELKANGITAKVKTGNGFYTTMIWVNVAKDEVAQARQITQKYITDELFINIQEI